MSSKKGGGPFSAGGTSSPSKEKSVPGKSSSGVGQLSQRMSDMTVTSKQDDGWEEVSRKSKARPGNSAAKTWGSRNNSKAWHHPDVQKLNTRTNPGPGQVHGNSSMMPAATDSRRPAGRGSSRPHLPNRTTGDYSQSLHTTITPPLEHGWKWAGRDRSSEYDTEEKVNEVDEVVEVDDNDDSDALDDTDDELLSDEFDSDASEKSHGTRKKNKWFKTFFENLDALSVEQINEPARQWHCPACHGGPGAIDWYRGLQPLLTHAKTKRSQKVKLHREFAQLLDEESRQRGTSIVPGGESFGKWKGLTEIVNDKEIVWPPMVVIMNTRLEQDENDKWLGMGNQELLEYFSSYAAVKARHSYGPQGHRGVSVLIFEATAVGYLEAERLSKHFEEEGTDRGAWTRRRLPFIPGGKRQLYGYMAEKQDLEYFNQHSLGKSKLKFELKSYQDMVVSQMKLMSEENQQLTWYKNKVAKEKRHSKAVEESFSLATEKLRRTMEENRIMKMRTKKQCEQNKEEMDSQEEFYKNQLKKIYEDRDVKEGSFEKIQQEEREKVQHSNANPSSVEDHRCSAENIEKFIKFQDKEMENLVIEKEKLLKVLEEKIISMKQRHWEEEVALEKEFDVELNKLMDKYTPQHLEDGKQG